MVVTKALLLPPHPHPFCSLPIPTKLGIRPFFTFHQVHPLVVQHTRKPKKHVAHVSLHDDPLVSCIIHQQQQNPYHLVLLAESAGYSLASYYTSLGLFVISVPGLWSLIKRSVKSKVILMLIFFFCFCLRNAALFGPTLYFMFSARYFVTLTNNKKCDRDCVASTTCFCFCFHGGFFLFC